MDVRWNHEDGPPAALQPQWRPSHGPRGSTGCRLRRKVCDSSWSATVGPELLWEVETCLFPELAAASHGTSALILLHLTRPLFVFLHRVIYQPVMRSKTLSGHSDNQPSFRVAEKYAFPATGFCCAMRFGPFKFVTGNDVGVDVKTQQHKWLFFLYERGKK